MQNCPDKIQLLGHCHVNVQGGGHCLCGSGGGGVVSVDVGCAVGVGVGGYCNHNIESVCELLRKGKVVPRQLKIYKTYMKFITKDIEYT